MNSVDIFNILSNNPHSKRIFRGVYALDELPYIVDTSRRQAFVINTDYSDGPGEHWVSVYSNGFGRAEFFDSFGLSPTYYAEIEKFINRNFLSYTYNKRLVQDLTSSFCGVYAIYFVLMKSMGRSLVRSLSVFDSYKLRNNDKRVLELVRRLLR